MMSDSDKAIADCLLAKIDHNPLFLRAGEAAIVVADIRFHDWIRGLPMPSHAKLLRAAQREADGDRRAGAPALRIYQR